jgi:integrative and conjugative element protein (TIGR02256 family)
MVTFKDKENDIIVTIEEAVLEELKTYSIQSYPNETGGFLVGRYISDNHANIKCLVPPTKKKGGPTSFERSSNGMKHIWNDLYNKGLIYLGEWHTHPNGSCIYSDTDLEAMRSITSSKGVKIKRPLLLIASINKSNDQDMNIYHYSNNKLIKISKWGK